MKNRNNIPRVVLAEESKTGLKFEIGPSQQKNYDDFPTSNGEESPDMRVAFFVIHFDLFFKITFQIMSKQLWNTQNQIRLVEYPCAKVSDPSEMPRFVGEFIF